MNKIILLGPRINKASGSSGGAVVLFEQLVDTFNQLNVNYIVIDTNKENYNSKYIAIYQICRNLVKFSNTDSILFLNSSNDYLYISLLLPILKYKKYILRKFGGEFIDSYEGKRGKIEKYLLAYAISKYNIIYLETKKLVKSARKFSSNIKYFPNVRDIKSFKFKEIYEKKLVYMGRIYKDKGIDQILNISSTLYEKGYIIDIYGPIIEENYKKKFLQNKFIEYKGVVASHDVLQVLGQYDLLLFPSEDEGEGYPGIIIEALSQGLPIIASSVGGVSEMVIDNKNGYLYYKYNAKHLLDSILKVNINNYINLSKNAMNSSKSYDSNNVTKKILKEIFYENTARNTSDLQ